MADLTLYADAKWESPWVFHAMVALEELRVPYRLQPIRYPFAEDIRTELQSHALLPKIPCIVHGDFWLTESSAISEYLAETYAPPAHPSIYPAEPKERARARQVLSWLRTSLRALRDDRPTDSIFMRPVDKPLSEKGKRDADELLRVTAQLLGSRTTTLFSTWSIADADLALMLMRLVANSDAVPPKIAEYTVAQWARQSVRKFTSYIPTTH
jgi:glutathione S-transferase